MIVITRFAKLLLPLPVRRWLRAKQQRLIRWPSVGLVRFGNLRRMRPISRVFGFDRGLPIDRYYIETFLTIYMEDIQGQVLEIGDDIYTRRFGSNRVTKSQVLHRWKDNPKATIIADLTNGDCIKSDTFDCIVLTQTLQFIYDFRMALHHLFRILKPGGILLATFPGISQISRYDMKRWGDYWRFTSLSAKLIFEEFFPSNCLIIKAYGNVLSAAAMLYGLATEEVKKKELDYFDSDYTVLIGVRAVKPKGMEDKGERAGK